MMLDFSLEEISQQNKKMNKQNAPAKKNKAAPKKKKAAPKKNQAEKLPEDIRRFQATLAFSQHDLIGGEFWAEFQGHADKCKGIVLAFNAALPETDLQYTALFEDGGIISYSLEELRRYNICFSSKELAKKQIYAQANEQVKKHY